MSGNTTSVGASKIAKGPVEYKWVPEIFIDGKMKSHELAEKVARLQHDLCILSMSNLSEERLHQMLDVISDQVAEYAKEAERYYPKEEDCRDDPLDRRNWNNKTVYE